MVPNRATYHICMSFHLSCTLPSSPKISIKPKVHVVAYDDVTNKLVLWIDNFIGNCMEIICLM